MTWGYDSWGYDNRNEPAEKKDLTKKCTCGMNITAGYDVPADRHSDWCELYKKEDPDDNSKRSPRRN